MNTQPRPTPTALRLKRSHLWQSLACLLFFSCMLVISLLASLYCAPPENKLHAILFPALVFAPMTALAAWALLRYWRHRLVIDQAQITFFGVVATKQIALADVTEVRWRPLPSSGCVLLRSKSTKLTIHLEEYATDRRLEIIGFLRKALPHSIQHGWKLFCYKCLLHATHRNRQPNHDEILVTRRRWDCYMGLFFVSTIPLGSYCWWLTANKGYLLVPLMVIPLWLLIRFTTPRTGYIAKKLSFRAPDAGFLAFILVSCAVALGTMCLYEELGNHGNGLTLVHVLVFVCWFAVLVVGSHWFDCRRQRRELAAAEQASDRLEQIEAELLADSNS